MNQSNSICFICLNSNISLKAILQNGSQNDIALQVQYVLPEVTIWDSVYICSLCCTSLHSFYAFKKRCLENYSRLIHKTEFLQRTSDAATQKLTEIKTKTCNMKQERNMDVELHEELIIKEDSEYLAPLVQEQGDQRIFADANTEDLILSKDNSEPESFPQPEFVKCEIESDCDKEETNTDNENYDNSEDSDSPQEKELCKDNTSISKKKIRKKRYKCSDCHRKFTCPSHLNDHTRTHMRVHTGEKPHQCHVCPYKTARADKLKIHMRVHTGEKPYSCQHCPKAFTRSTNLNDHKRIHNSNEEASFNLNSK